jgi:hypothetical protein
MTSDMLSLLGRDDKTPRSPSRVTLFSLVLSMVTLLLLFDSVVSLYEYFTCTRNLQWGAGLLLMVEIMRDKDFGYILFVLQFLFIEVTLAMFVAWLYDKVVPNESAYVVICMPNAFRP